MVPLTVKAKWPVESCLQLVKETDKTRKVHVERFVATTPLEPSRKLVHDTNWGTHASATSERSGHTHVRVCVRASDSQPINASSPHSGWPIRSRQRLPRHFPCRLPASRFTRWFGVSPLSLSLALLYTYVLVTVNTESLSSQRLSFLPLWGHSLY